MAWGLKVKSPTHRLPVHVGQMHTRTRSFLACLQTDFKETVDQR